MKNKIILIVFVLFLAGTAGFYIWQDINKARQGAENVKHQTSNNVEVCDTAEEGQEPEECVDEMVPEEKPAENPAIQAPDLDKPVVFTISATEDVKNIIRQKIAVVRDKLKNDTATVEDWLELGLLKKMAGDYTSAAEIWEYVVLINPDNFTAYNNLGDIYAYYLKDNKKAEKNFVKAMEKGPEEIYIYRNAHDFYKNVLKDDARARQILEKGIELNPDTSQDLKFLLDNI